MSTIEDRKKRLADAQARRDRIQRDVDRLQGRLDSAKKEKEKVEQECRDRKVDPDKLPEIRAALEEAFDKSLDEFEADLDEAESKIQPFLETTDED